MKKIINILLLLSVGLLFNSCYYDTLVEEPIVEIPTDPGDPGYIEISFSDDLQPVFSANCVQCHNGTVDPDLSEGNSFNALVPDYVTAENADNSKLYTQVLSGHGGLSNSDIALIKGWINQGANNN